MHESRYKSILAEANNLSSEDCIYEPMVQRVETFMLLEEVVKAVGTEGLTKAEGAALDPLFTRMAHWLGSRAVPREHHKMAPLDAAFILTFALICKEFLPRTFTKLIDEQPLYAAHECEDEIVASGKTLVPPDWVQELMDDVVSRGRRRLFAHFKSIFPPAGYY